MKQMSEEMRTGSAKRWGPLWGARASAWAEVEDRQLPTYEEAIHRVGIGAGMRVLDVGCGTGRFLQAAADVGADAWGLDASEELLEIARDRVPAADLSLGDMQALPYAEDTFDVVTGFNSFFFASDLESALREAGRVARSGAAVVIQVWGRPEHCELGAIKSAVAPFMPAPQPGAPKPLELWSQGVLEALATGAGLEPDFAFDSHWAFEFEDAASALRCLMSPGINEIAVRASGEDRVAAAIAAAIEPFRTASGGYRLENEWHYLVARAQ